MTQPNNSQRLWMYEQMLTSRYMEESIERIYMEGKTPVFNMAKGPIPGEMHLSNGQEPCAVGVCAHLNAEDIVTATHRPHHIAVAKGVHLNEMVAEIFGKQTGLSGGRGGHMHLFDARVNFACSGIIAEGMGPAVGAALYGTDGADLVGHVSRPSTACRVGCASRPSGDASRPGRQAPRAAALFQPFRPTRPGSARRADR